MIVAALLPPARAKLYGIVELFYASICCQRPHCLVTIRLDRYRVSSECNRSRERLSSSYQDLTMGDARVER
jgi:hypothetical protein